MIVILMGVTGAGKTTVGEALAAGLHWGFVDADSYHSVASVEKMRAGIPLTDEDRAPWLTSLHNAIVEWLTAGANVVLACSALKAAYRERLVVSAEVKLVYLRADRDLIAKRLVERQHHYMNPALVDSQFATLEEPQQAVTVDAGLPAEAVVDDIRRTLAI
jgi:gluconokinase